MNTILLNEAQDLLVQVREMLPNDIDLDDAREFIECALMELESLKVPEKKQS